MSKVNVENIPDEQIHNGTVVRKPLIKASQASGRVVTYNFARLVGDNILTPHTHPDGEEYYLFLEGEGEILVGEKWIPVSRGDFVTIPKNTAHSLKNTGPDLVFTTLRTLER